MFLIISKIYLSLFRTHVNYNLTNNENPVYEYGVLVFEGMINNAGSITNITNDGIVKMMNKTASYSTVGLSTAGSGKIDNSVCNNMIVASNTETIYCEVSEPMTFTEVQEFVEDSNSELVRFVEGANTLTIDVTENEDGTLKTTNIVVDDIEIAANLTVVSENRNAVVRMYGESETEKMNITINDNVTATLGSGVKLQIGRANKGANINAVGKLVVTNSAVLSGYSDQTLTFVTNSTVENYGVIGGCDAEYKEESVSVDWTGSAATKKKAL